MKDKIKVGQRNHLRMNKITHTDISITSRMNMAIQDHCKDIISKQNQLILGRLQEMGYDISDKIAIAKRLEIRTLEGSEVREILIDTNTPEQALVCCVTETQTISDSKNPYKITTEFRFSPMPTNEPETEN